MKGRNEEEDDRTNKMAQRMTLELGQNVRMKQRERRGALGFIYLFYFLTKYQ